MRHRFPKNNPTFFKIWIDNIKPKYWETLSVQQIYNKYSVCHAHFEKCYHLVGSLRGLTVHAVPTLGVPGVNNNNVDEPMNTSSNYETEMEISQPEDSEGIMEFTTQNGVPKVFNDDFNQPSTSKNYIQPIPSVSQPEELPNFLEPSTQEKRRIASGKGILSTLNCTRKKHLNAREQILYKIICNIRKNMNQKKYRIQNYKERISVAQKLLANAGLQNVLSQVNEATCNFIRCQIRNKNQKRNARRFTFDEKVLALALYEASPKGYRLLYKLFCLPLSRTLSRLLEKLTFNPGLNAHIFQQLEHTVSQIKSRQDKVCALIFDEMSLSTNLKYDQVADKIIGVEDDGSERKARLVDHANVFFLKGL
ncbi:uncharacterized protein LOC123672401 [Harmonia axyridis]|uniref:uncharacterized protein LOC123672401 n=1 Tax=Harmonia axyridis TaxID=115357 RepID=UPI001E278629|nr:uncharacterized protein LOC123672401 [Harmonia axyridis]